MATLVVLVVLAIFFRLNMELAILVKHEGVAARAGGRGFVALPPRETVLFAVAKLIYYAFPQVKSSAILFDAVSY